MASRRLTSALAVAGVLLVGCSASETAAPATEASAPESARASASCTDFLGALDRIVPLFADLTTAVGSDVDETARLSTLQQYTATMAADASECAPEAAAALTTLRDETITLAEAYVPNADGAVGEGIFLILVDIRATGEQAWAQMGRPGGAWQELPLNEDGSTVR